MADSEANHGVSGTSTEDETSPDLLKNTPSNIARLEDVIEHSKGRQKYLAVTSSPSDGSDVRWYFCKVPLAENELAASVPRTEIVGKGDYFRFGMRDSLAMEASFLQREEELLSSWWKEYAECSEGPRARAISSKESDMQSNTSCLEASRSTQLYENEEERVGVPVKGGLYEVDLVKRHCFPVYWNGENRRVLRGHWFARKGGLDWLPLREDVAEQLEAAYRRQVWHRRTFQLSGLFAARVELQGSGPGLHALFTGEDNTWEAWLNIDASGFSSILSFSANGIKLRRGYSASHSPKPTQDELRQQKEEAMDDYCSQWRKGLKLSGEAAVEKITLDGVRGLRVMLSATVHDVLYYMSPIYCQDIINSVSNQLNWLYLKFLKRNPGYDGKVSIYGHSLGSVLSYDILCHQEKLSSPFPMDWMFKEDAGNEGSSCMNNQSSTHTSKNTGDNSFTLMNESKDIVHNVDEDVVSIGSTILEHEEECAEDSSSTVSPNAQIDETLRSVDSERMQGTEGVHDLTNISSQEDGQDVDVNLNSGVPENSLEEKADEECKCDSDKDKTIKLLREEIDSLKAKMAELASHSCRREADDRLLQESKEVPEAEPNRLLTEKLPPISEDSPKSYTPYIKYTKLEFKVDTFFAVGSPLGVFLSLRNIRIGTGKGQEYWCEENINEEMPACRQMLNIFHPFDPVAYRIEPLVCKEYITKRPVIIPYHRGGKRLHIGFQELTEDLAARSQAVIDQFNFVRAKVLSVCQSRSMDNLEERAEKAEEKEERSYGSIMMERLTGSDEGRIDHVLQDKTFEHPYLQAIGAHTNYWRDYDTALFILKHLYRDIPEDPHILEELSRVGNGGSGSASQSWTDQREAADEELPLTFSNRNIVRSFSKKAKKFIKS